MKKNKDPKQAYKLVALHAIHPRAETRGVYQGLEGAKPTMSPFGKSKMFSENNKGYAVDAQCKQFWHLYTNALR